MYTVDDTTACSKFFSEIAWLGGSSHRVHIYLLKHVQPSTSLLSCIVLLVPFWALYRGSTPLSSPRTEGGPFPSPATKRSGPPSSFLKALQARPEYLTMHQFRQIAPIPMELLCSLFIQRGIKSFSSPGVEWGSFQVLSSSECVQAVEERRQ